MRRRRGPFGARRGLGRRPGRATVALAYKLFDRPVAAALGEGGRLSHEATLTLDASPALARYVAEEALLVEVRGLAPEVVW